jgi:RNA polymerase sigma-70 factor (ECF subfamily)
MTRQTTTIEPARPVTDADRLDEVLELFAQYQRSLYLYIHSLLTNPADADEALQETNIVVWRKFEQFQPGSDFRAWVFRIAFFEVRKLCERRRRQGLAFSEEMLDQLAVASQQRAADLEARTQRLNECVEKLRPNDRDLVGRVYGQAIEVPQLAIQMGREQTSIYRSLRRIRQLLLDCIEGNLGTEAAT